MAVKQRIAMLGHDELQACHTSETALDRVISFKLGENRYADLDWSPYGLEQCFEHSGQSPELCEALRLSVEGSELVNPLCPEGVGDYIVYSRIMFLSVTQVKAISEQLQQVDLDKLFSWLPGDVSQAVGMFKGIDPRMNIHPRLYYEQYFLKLRTFYQTATGNVMATVMWWD